MDGNWGWGAEEGPRHTPLDKLERLVIPTTDELSQGSRVKAI